MDNEKWPKDWEKDESGEHSMSKTTTNPDGSTKEESLRANEGDKADHQHTWVDKDKDGNLTGGGATPGKKK